MTSVAKLAAAVLLSCASVGHVHAQSTTVIYGHFNVAAERVRGSMAQGSSSRLSNYRSSMGFRGQEDLGDGLYAVFQLEGSIAPDTGAGSFTNRDTRVGMRGPFGTVFAGNWTLPYTSATSSFDPFYPTTAGYMAIMGNGSAASSDNISDRSAFDRRQQNVVQYWTPAWGPFSARAAYGVGEGVIAATGATPSLASFSATYDTKDLTAVVAFEAHRHYHTATTTDTAEKVGMAYRTGPWSFSGLLERLDYETSTGSLTRLAAYVSAVYKQDRLSLLAGVSRAQAGRGPSTETVGFVSSGPNTDAVHFTTGAEYALSKQSSGYLFYSRINNGAGARYDFAINSLGIQMGERPSGFAVGFRHFF